MDKLKPCLHCGGAVKVFFYRDNEKYVWDGDEEDGDCYPFIECQECGATYMLGEENQKGSELVSAWNSMREPERTAKIRNPGEGIFYPYGICICGRCEQCGNAVCERFNYCSSCGCKLEWK